MACSSVAGSVTAADWPVRRPIARAIVRNGSSPTATRMIASVTVARMSIRRSAAERERSLRRTSIDDTDHPLTLELSEERQHVGGDRVGRPVELGAQCVNQIGDEPRALEQLPDAASDLVERHVA